MRLISLFTSTASGRYVSTNQSFTMVWFPLRLNDLDIPDFTFGLAAKQLCLALVSSMESISLKEEAKE